MDALFMCAYSSPSLAQRRQAANLMRRPKSEGLWPTLMASRIADAVLDREIEILREYKYEASGQAQFRSEGETTLMHQEAQAQQEPTEAQGGKDGNSRDYPEDSPHGLHRMRRLVVKLENGRRAKMTLQTWGESVSGLPGQESILTW